MSQACCTFQVRGLDCAKEEKELRDALRDQAGISELSFDLMQQNMTVAYDSQLIDPLRLTGKIIERTGMSVTLLGDARITTQNPAWWSQHPDWLLTLATGAALSFTILLAWLGLRMGLTARSTELMAFAGYLVAVILGAIGLFPKAIRNLRQYRFDIDVLMAFAVIGAVLLGQWDEAATVAFLYMLAEALEGFSLERARRSIRALLEMTPATAERVGRDGTVSSIPSSQVNPNDRILVRTGDTIPVDGSILTGRSNVDQKTITGESVPVLREPGDPVFAGTINGEGALEIAASGPSTDSLIARVVAQVRANQSGKAPIERSITRFAGIYTPIVMALSLGVMLLPPLVLSSIGHASLADLTLWRAWFSEGLVILVIACPCALVIATPVAIVSGLAAAARAGILIRGGEFLEEIGQLRALAFDKTGTLTMGQPDVVEVVCAPGQDDQSQVLRIAAALGDRGGHVLGKAIARHARDLRIDVPMADNYRAVPGLGARGHVEAEEYHLGSHRFIDESGLCQPAFHDQLGHAERSTGTAVALTGSAGPLGWIRLADRPRPEAASVLQDLHALGIQTVMLTGDNARTAAAVASELGVGEQRADLLPADKVSAIAELDARHGPTGMVGDGVNDAPALAAAKVSIALGGISSGAALETADIVLLADDLSRLPWLVRHSRATLARIRQNIILALATKAVVLVLALLGLANLWMAIAADVGTSLLVVANALRLLRSPTP